MNVFVLEGYLPYEGSTVLGVYASYREAVEAAQAYDQADREEQYPVRYHYLVNEVVLGAPARGRTLEGDDIEVD